MSEEKITQSNQDLSKRKSLIRKPSKSGWFILGIVVALALVFSVGYKAGENRSENSTAETKKTSLSTSPYTLNSSLKVLGVEQTLLLNRAIAAKINNSNDATAIKQSVYDNLDDTAASIGNASNMDAEKAYLEAQKLFVDQMFIFTDAVISKNEATKEKVQQTIQGDFTKKINDFASKYGQGKQGDGVLAKTANDQFNLVTSIILQHAQGHYTEELESQKQAVKNAEVYYDLLTSLISK